MKRFQGLVRRFVADESGQGTVEWVLLTALVVIAIMILIYAFRNQIKDMMTKATETMSGWGQ